MPCGAEQRNGTRGGPRVEIARRIRAFSLVAVAVVVACGGQTAGSSSAAQGTKPPFDYAANLITPGTLEVATTGAVPGQTFLNASGVPEGERIDQCNAVAQKLGLKVHFNVVDFASVLAGVSAGRYDVTCTGIFITPERQASKDFFLTMGDLRNATSGVSRADDTRFKGSLKDGKGLTMGGTQGAVHAGQISDFLGKDVKIVTYPGVPEMVLDLKNKRIDFYADNLLAADYVIKNDAALKLVDTTGIAQTVSAEVVSRKEPELLKAWNAAIQSMLADGTIAAMQKKWFGVGMLPPSPSPSQ